MTGAGDVSVRSGRLEDATSVLELWRISGALPTETDDLQSIIRVLNNNNDALIVAEADGGIVASVIAAWDGWRGNLYRLAVNPDRRREGIATRLVREAEGRLIARGAVRLSILVPKKGPAAEFWSRMGYSEDIRVSRFVKSRTSVTP